MSHHHSQTTAASAAGLKPCPNGANNCFSAASTDKNQLAKWKFPAGENAAQAAASLTEVLGAYPQAGQNGVDLGGWTVAEDALADRG